MGTQARGPGIPRKRDGRGEEHAVGSLVPGWEFARRRPGEGERMEPKDLDLECSHPTTPSARLAVTAVCRQGDIRLVIRRVASQPQASVPN